jgi:hypothetical protein
MPYATICICANCHEPHHIELNVIWRKYRRISAGDLVSSAFPSINNMDFFIIFRMLLGVHSGNAVKKVEMTYYYSF